MVIKKGLLATLVLVIALPVSSLSAFASDSKSTESEMNALSIDSRIVQTKVLDPSLSIEKYSDGRVKGIKNVDNLNENQKKSVLKEMRFGDEEINIMPENLKEELISTGGVKVDLQTENKEEYHSLDGQTYVMNADNKDLIQKIKEADINRIKNESGPQVSLMNNSINDGAFSAYHSLFYNGKTSNAKEFQYSYLTYYSMGETILPAAVDKVGTAWQVHATRTNAAAYTYTSPNSYYNTSVNVSSVYGTSTSYVPANVRGYMKNDVNIPVTLVGTTSSFASSYAHPYTVLSPSVTFGPVSVSFSSFVGPIFTWSSSFTIGNSSLNP